jgi:hypothetical protein
MSTNQQRSIAGTCVESHHRSAAAITPSRSPLYNPNDTVPLRLLKQSTARMGTLFKMSAPTNNHFDLQYICIRTKRRHAGVLEVPSSPKPAAAMISYQASPRMSDSVLSANKILRFSGHTRIPHTSLRPSKPGTKQCQPVCKGMRPSASLYWTVNIKRLEKHDVVAVPISRNWEMTLHRRTQCRQSRLCTCTRLPAADLLHILRSAGKHTLWLSTPGDCPSYDGSFF